MEKEYAQALMRQVASGADERALVEGLVAHLGREGRMKLLPGILRELKALDARRAKLAPSVEVASEGEATHAIAAARTMGIEARLDLHAPDRQRLPLYRQPVKCLGVTLGGQVRLFRLASRRLSLRQRS